jgi:DNA-binding protein YbaB
MQMQVNRLIAEFGEAQRDFEVTQARIGQTSATTWSKNRVLSVTVGAAGDVTDVTFHSGAYRSMAPAELSALVLGTLRAARADVTAQVREAVAGCLPPGMTAERLFAGADPAAGTGPAVAAGPVEPGSVLGRLRELFGDAPAAATPAVDEDGWTGERTERNASRTSGRRAT